MSLAGAPDESIGCPPAVCCGCGADLASEPVTARRRHQITDIEPAPAPKVIEYVAQAKECAGCGAVSAGELPAHVRAHASYGPESCARAANLVNGHHIPVHLRDRFRVRNAHANQVTAGAGKQPRPDGMVSPRG
jgi:transposase